ncbi:MFS transporter [Flavobacterium ardleyense]|uniref:MFS transporter n=1 Tax=Flavobacterium ardleyense TaxID=2038737 RepID=A0ABW5Z4Z7_9FLAO
MDQKLKTLQTIHLALVMGIVIAYFVLLDKNFIINFKFPKIEGEAIVFAIIPVVAILLGNFLFNKTISKVDSRLSVEEKFTTFQTASIIRWAVLEGAAFLILILKPELFIFGILLLIYFIITRPSENQVRNYLS